jgi:hypothetical protein
MRPPVVPAARASAPEPKFLSRNDWSWIGRAGFVFFRKSVDAFLVAGVKHEPQHSPRRTLAASCERISYALRRSGSPAPRTLALSEKSPYLGGARVRLSLW